MLVDHTLLVFGVGHWARVTVTRASMPLFFLVSGHLVGRLSWRHAGVLAVGLVLPYAVPWIDRPNVLVWYVMGAALLWYAQWSGDYWMAPLLVIVGLAAYANGYSAGWGPHSYEPGALVGLMALGWIFRRDYPLWNAGAHLPAVFAWLGRFPLSVYVGHLLALQLVVHARGGF